uniref:F5/8 type C domain-containing protein n=1 Tax=Spongospora subterranea TaxID=70186 RepID=A0A0H5R242_9EUKA|eukprot:CRZ01914.1 hypothetical protein [Spongospora subterranea]
MIDLEDQHRITKVRLQNRHSLEFQIMFRDQGDAPWLELIPPTNSGRHKAVIEVVLRKTGVYSRKLQTELIGRYLLVRLLGRSNCSYHTSIYWIEVHGMRTPGFCEKSIDRTRIEDEHSNDLS